MSNSSTPRQQKIDRVLAKIDQDAHNGYCSHWAETDETRTALIVTLADGSKRRFSLPRA